MYSEIIPLLNMCTALRYIYSKLGIDDFGLNDICDPSPKRTYNLFQTMMNFIRYCDHKIIEVDSKMEAIRNKKERIDKLKMQKDIIKNLINQKSLVIKQRGIEIKTVADEVKTSKAKLINVQKEFTVK